MVCAKRSTKAIPIRPRTSAGYAVTAITAAAIAGGHLDTGTAITAMADRGAIATTERSVFLSEPLPASAGSGSLCFLFQHRRDEPLARLGECEPTRMQHVLR